MMRELHSITSRSKYFFPALQTLHRPISENTVNVALRRLGYSKEEMTGHGFRAMASILLNEQGWHPDVIELQLTHAERNKVRAAYNRAQRLPERRRMMEAWADYLEALAAGAKVFVLNAGHSETQEHLFFASLKFFHPIRSERHRSQSHWVVAESRPREIRLMETSPEHTGLGLRAMRFETI